MSEPSGDSRLSVSADLKRRVLIEAGHRCAIPTCRHIEVDFHHIIPWAQCKEHKYENLIALCPNCHRRADRKEIDRKSLRLYKLNLRFVHDKFSQLEIDIMFEVAKLQDGQFIDWPPVMNIMLKRVLDAGYVAIQKNPHGGVRSLGLQISPDRLIITPKGRAFVRELGMHEL